MILNTSYVRPKKRIRLLEVHERVEERKNICFVTSANSIILPLRDYHDAEVIWGRGGVICPDGGYIEFSGTVGHVYGCYPVEEYEIVHKNVVFCGYLHGLYGEFILQSLTRLWYYLENDNPTIDKYVYIVGYNEARTVSGNFKRIFELLGVWDRIMLVSTPTQFDNVIVPEDSYQSQSYYSEKFNNCIDALVSAALEISTVRTFQKVFLTRSSYSATNGNDIGLNILDDFCSGNGYEVVSPENIPIEDLIKILVNAEEVASPSGTCAHNFIFSNRLSKVVVFERYPNTNPMQADIIVMRDLNVTYVDINLPIYLVVYSNGVCILSYTECFKKYVEENDMLPPARKYYCEKAKKNYLRRYFKIYRKKYYYTMCMNGWILWDIALLAEGYYESYDWFGDYLEGRRALWWWQRLEPRMMKTHLRKVLELVGK